MKRRIGIDVGGTNTDAVYLEDTRVIHAVKTPTTRDVTAGVADALRRLLQSGAPAAVDAVMIGTTHFTNAVVQRRDLTRVAAIRIGLPSGASLEPFIDWPEDLAALVRGEVFMLEGGHEFDGRPLVPLDSAGVRAAARRVRAAGLTSVGVASVFSPLNAACELEAAAILREECPDAAVTLSHQLGRIGLLERENATLLNAALVGLARTTTRAFTAGARRQRDHRAALPHAERRHGDAGLGRRGVSRLRLRVGPDEQHARRRVPLEAHRRARHRRRRDHHRHRQPAPRLSPRGQQRGRDRRGANALPHAGFALDRPRRRLARRACSPGGRPAQRRLSPGRGGARVRRQASSRPRTSPSPPGSSTSATGVGSPRCRPTW